jgi:tetratricopeptide (TPR) repeat protein
MTSDLKNKINIVINRFHAGDFDYVKNECTILLKKEPNSDYLWNLMGLAQQSKKELVNSKKSFLKAIKLNSKNFVAMNNLGNTYKYLKDYQNAEMQYEAAININEKYISSISNMANLKNETFHFKDAIKFYKRAISINDNIPELYFNAAANFQHINQVDDSKKYLMKALAVNKNFTKADHRLSSIINYNKEDQHLLEMIDKLKNLELNQKEKIYLYFGIAKGYEDKKDYKNAFIYFKLGNQSQRTITDYNKKNYEKLLISIKSYFNEFKFTNHKNIVSKQKFIFILGMPRSGTTLIEKIISTHSKVSTVSEINFLPKIITDNIINNFQINKDLTKDFLKENLTKKYEKQLLSYNINKETIIDKTLLNFWYVGFIKIFFPNSKIIHCKRNAKDNCFSIYKNLFDVHEGWCYDEEELANYYMIYSDIMNFWNNKLGKEILEVKYETLVKNSKDEIKKIINFCNLDWEESCLKFNENNNPIKTLSVNQTNKPIYKTSIDSSKNFKEELSELFSKLN